jgi:histone H3/H4
MAEDEDATTVQPPMAQEDNVAPIPPESGDENPLGSASEEENTAPIQLVPEEENAETVQPDMGEEEDAAEAQLPMAEEANAATTGRGESGEENAVGPESEEENTETIQLESGEENAATIQSASERKKAKPIQPERKENEAEPIRLELPTGRVKKIMKLDRDINKVNSEALHLVSCSAQLFLQFLAEGSGEAAMEKKRKIVKLEHIRTAAKRHRATRDFLVDELPVPSQPSDQKSTDRSRSRPVADNPAPAGTRRIDDFFRKPATESPIQIEES